MSTLAAWCARVARRIADALAPEAPAASPRPADLLQTLGAVVVGLRPDHSIFEWNREAERVFGFTRAEALGRDYFRLLLPPAIWPAIADDIRRVLSGTPTQYYENEVRHRDGVTRRHMLWNVSRVVDGRGTPVGILATGQDISERRVAEERFRILFERATDAQLLFDDTGIIDCNQAAVDMLRARDKADLFGRHPGTFSPELQPDGRRSAEKRLEMDMIARREGYHRFEWTHRRLTGELFPVEVTLNPVVVNGRDCLLVVWHDITNRKRSEAALAAARDAALAAARAKTQFMATMSHEIRTPMNGIIGMTELLLDSALNHDQRELAETAHASARALLTVLNDILDFSKLEAERLQIEQVTFDLRQLVEDVVELLSPQAAEKGVTLVYGVDPRTPRLVIGDPLRLRQVLLNLLSNALKFTPAGEVTLQVLVAAHEDDALILRVDVTDTGIGIAESDQQRLFDSFTQLDASTTRRFGGTGLGLAISRRLIELMGGRIGVSSAPAQGSRFWFSVRLALPPDRHALPPLRPLLGKTALVVEAHPLSRRLARDLLADMGAEVTAVATPDTVVSAGAFDIVVADASHPDTAGRHVTVLAGPRPADVAPAAGVVYVARPLREGVLRRTLQSSIAGAPAASGPATVARPSPARRGRVLVAEDNLVNQRVAVRLLDKLGFDAETVDNGEAALARAGEPWVAILMDCQMPRMDGFEATAAIRALEQRGGGRRVPIIALTAEALAGDRERCLKAGMDDYVAKPVHADALDAAMNRWAPRPVLASELQATHR